MKVLFVNARFFRLADCIMHTARLVNNTKTHKKNTFRSYAMYRTKAFFFFFSFQNTWWNRMEEEELGLNRLDSA